MKCRVCGKQAIVRLPAYNTAFCSDDFIAFFEKRVSDTIRKYDLVGGREKLLIAVSGGKDSLSLWHLAARLGLPADGLYIDLGIADYSDVSFEKARQMSAGLGRRLYSFSIDRTFNKGIKDLSKLLRRPACSLCGTIKRYVMNRACTDHGYTILATGHNLDDEASALLGNVLHWKEEYLWKKGVSLEGDGIHLAKKVKPFFLCSEKEVATYALLNGIDYIYDECPYSVGAKTLLYKSLLNRVEESSPATKIAFLKGYLKRTKEEEKKEERSYCTRCGYPSYGERCNFCRLLEKFGIEAGVSFRIYDPDA